jgi:hypothetical protein
MEVDQIHAKYAKTSVISGLFYLLADVVLFPFDTISTRLKASKIHLQISTTQFVFNSLQRDGIGLYRGMSITIFQSFVPTVIYLYLYEYLLNKTSKIIDQFTDKKELKLVTPFFVSCIAKALPLVIELPFDTLRTRFQVFIYNTR